MELHIREGKHFFVAVPLNAKEVIAFEYTPKKRRVLKQVLAARKPFPRKKPEAEWETLVLRDRKLAKVAQTKWLPADGKDQYNDELWETVWEKPISKELADAINEYSQFIQKHQKSLAKHQKELLEFENLMHKALAEQIVAILQGIKKK